MDAEDGFPVFVRQFPHKAITKDSRIVDQDVDSTIRINHRGYRSIYVIGQGFGLTWKPTYVQVTKRKRQTARDMFKDDEDDGEAPFPVAGGAKAALVSDDEDEEDEADESAPAPAPAPAAAPTPTIVEISESKPAAKSSGRRKVGSAAP